jgi:hypothetical protein
MAQATNPRWRSAIRHAARTRGHGTTFALGWTASCGAAAQVTAVPLNSSPLHPRPQGRHRVVGGIVLGRIVPGRIVPGRIVPGRIVPGRIVPGRIVPGRIVAGPNCSGRYCAGRALWTGPAVLDPVVFGASTTDGDVVRLVDLYGREGSPAL